MDGYVWMDKCVNVWMDTCGWICVDGYVWMDMCGWVCVEVRGQPQMSFLSFYLPLFFEAGCLSMNWKMAYGIRLLDQRSQGSRLSFHSVYYRQMAPAYLYAGLGAKLSWS